MLGNRRAKGMAGIKQRIVLPDAHVAQPFAGKASCVLWCLAAFLQVESDDGLRRRMEEGDGTQANYAKGIGKRYNTDKIRAKGWKPRYETFDAFCEANR